jgi:hypothetical protein
MGQSIKLKDNTFWDVSAIRNVVNVRVADTNLNSYVQSGCYYFDSNVTPLNIPVGTNGWLQVIAEQPLNEGRGSGYVKQFWFRSGTVGDNDHQMYMRTANVGVTNWGSWVRLLVDKDLNAITNTIDTKMASAKAATDSNLSALASSLNRQIFFEAGDIYENASIIYCGGHITNGSKDICTNVALPERMSNVSTITVTGYDFTVRSTAGAYILNRATSGLTVNAGKADSRNLQLTIKSPSALNATNNTPVAVAIYGLKLTFN